MKKVLNEKTFIVFHDDFKEEFVLRNIPNDEKLNRWIDLPPHTNIVTAFDVLTHDGKQFSLCENTNGGTVYSYIETLNLNLALNVPQSYIELIYDCAIQLAPSMLFPQP